MTRIVVLGGGFAGMETLRCLERGLGRRDDVELLLVSEENYLLFTPLLPQVASSMVEHAASWPWCPSRIARLGPSASWIRRPSSSPIGTPG